MKLVLLETQRRERIELAPLRLFRVESYFGLSVDFFKFSKATSTSMSIPVSSEWSAWRIKTLMADGGYSKSRSVTLELDDRRASKSKEIRS